eukprot:CAMPEP_0206412684 /NCGR_PEP_ID=MMETSP0294-20121207/34176_1 /ASSEMBLY_ACC=CAM_ASM_000327 /TAXON_ID=39354 /ORGANISM="Heterosigma akashiwo, Strain CCMP2393" /LENGTH=98 /DNA_ID=CAMNT_0053873951 /DNA_START=153 /DNA_END=449 /DNA_ORIENTATION=-
MLIVMCSGGTSNIIIVNVIAVVLITATCSTTISLLKRHVATAVLLPTGGGICRRNKGLHGPVSSTVTVIWSYVLPQLALLRPLSASSSSSPSARAAAL